MRSFPAPLAAPWHTDCFYWRQSNPRGRTTVNISQCTPTPIVLRSGPQRAVLTDLLTSIRSCRNETYALWEHSLAVAATARQLAAQLGLSRELRRLAYLSGLLHDVGKSAMCYATLFKPGPLTTEERTYLRLHPQLGANMVQDLKTPEILDAVNCHHELFDGSGYPFGLQATQIPILARIVGVADYYEALRESRPYRPLACTHSEAIGIISTLAECEKLDPMICAHLEVAVGPNSKEPVKLFERFSIFFELSVSYSARPSVYGSTGTPSSRMRIPSGSG